MTKAADVRKQIIGAAGETLVTYKLLKHSIDSARMTTDDGIDLVMYLPLTRRTATIQVKSLWKPVPAGGKGALSLGWVFNPRCPAEWLALVDLSRDRAWLFTMAQAKQAAQQQPESGSWRIYWYPDGTPVRSRPRFESDMAGFEIETAVGRLLTGQPETES